MNDQVNQFGDKAVSDGGNSGAVNQFGDAPITSSVNKPLQFLNQIAQGATFGWGDEISAAMVGAMNKVSGGSFRDAYDFALGDIRGDMEQFEEENPGLAATGEILGAVTTGGMGGARLLNTSRSLSPAARYGQIMALGAAEGGAYGAGASDGGRVLPALQGALMGSVLAPAGTKAADFLIQGGRSAASFLGRKLGDTPRSQALRAIRNAAISENIDPDDAIRMLDELGPEATIADLGEEFRKLARAASDLEGDMRTRSRNLFNQRQMGQQDRLMRSAEIATGARAGDFNSARQSLIQSRNDTARPLYQAAFDMGVETTENLDSLMQRPALKSALRGAERLARDMGEWDGEMNLLQRLHFAKMNLDDQIGRARRSGAGNQVRALTQLKNDLLAEIDNQNPSYFKARNVYAGDSAMIDAMDQGINLFKMSADEIDEVMSGMSQAEKDLFKLGGVRAIREKLDSVYMNSDASRRLLGTKANRDRLGKIMDNPESFIRQALAEGEFSRTRQMVTGGSQTSTNLAAQETLSETIQPDFIAGLITQDAASAGRGLLRMFSRNKVTPETVKEIGDLLLSQGMSPAKLMDVFSTPALREGLGATYQEVILPAIAGAIGTGAGSMAAQ